VADDAKKSGNAVAANSILILLLLGGTAALLYFALFSGDPADDHTPVPRSSFLFPTFEFDVDRLAGEYDEQRLALPELEIGVLDEAIIEEFHDLNDQFASGELDPEELSALRDHMIVSVSEYISARGPLNYDNLGWYLHDRFQGAITDLLAMVASTGNPVLQVLRADTSESLRIRERVGHFLEFAMERGLADSSGQLIYDPSLLSVLFRYRWYSFAEAYANLSRLTPYEQSVFWRWRIEAAVGFSMTQRLAMVDEAEAIYLPDTDPDAIRGIIAYEAGELQRAHTFFLRAAQNSPEHPEYREWLDEVAGELE
jgi:hypothetical protein